jgi:hypothetical protein
LKILKLLKQHHDLTNFKIIGYRKITKLALIETFTLLSCNAYSQVSLGKMISKSGRDASTPAGQDEERKTP